MNHRYVERGRYYVWLLTGDFLLLLGSFIGAYALRRGHLWIEPEFQLLVPWILGFWLVFTLLSGKFMRLENPEFVSRVRPFLQVGVALTGAVSLLLYLKGWYHVSRFITYGTLGTFLGMEILALTAHHYLLRRRSGETRAPVTGILFLMDICLLFLSLALVYNYHRGTLALGEDFPLLLLGLSLAWLASALMSHRFRLRRDRGLIPTLTPFWKGQGLMLVMVVSIIFITGQEHFSRTIVLGTILTFFVLENLGVALLRALRLGAAADDTATGVTDAPVPGVIAITEAARPASIEGPYSLPESELQSVFLRGQLASVYLAGRPELMAFLDDNLDLGAVDVTRAAVLETPAAGPLQRLPENGLEFIMNLHRVNDFRRVNFAFLQAHRVLKPGGILVVNFESLTLRRERFIRRYSLPLARLFWIADFLYRRLMPRLPVVKKIYFAISRGRNRVLSFTECLGRLFYCGFNVISWKVIDGRIYFILHKNGPPQSHRTPSYGPVFRQRRLGKNGEILGIYKLRTMHPYSEYLQSYVHRHHQLEEGGKIRADFRVTPWGRFMRRWLLDELPMLWNWLRRDLKLVGVRPLTEAFFATYPQDLQELRLRFKPGLIPPYYADMPSTIQEVWESERKYLEQYAKKPVRTDAKYFFKAIYNILFHHARSA